MCLNFTNLAAFFWVERLRPLPAAPATTSDNAQLHESFQATSSQTARAQLEKAATPPATTLWHIQQQQELT